MGRFYAWATPEALAELSEPQLYLYESQIGELMEMEARRTAVELAKILYPKKR